MKRFFSMVAFLLVLGMHATAQTSDVLTTTATDSAAVKHDAAPSPTPALHDSSKWFSSLFAAEGGGGWDSSHPYRPTAHLGVKFGGTVNVDAQYDLIHGQSAFSTEVSGMLPVFRLPGPMAASTRKYVRVYFEPGLGYRAGSGPFGGYSSAKVMVALFDDQWGNTAYPFVEFQRRFPFDSPLQGDNRISIGFMFAVCEHCGMN